MIRVGEAVQMIRKLVRRPTMQDDREGFLSLLYGRPDTYDWQMTRS